MARRSDHIALMCSLAVAFTACGGDDDDASGEITAVETETTSASTDPTATAGTTIESTTTTSESTTTTSESTTTTSESTSNTVAIASTTTTTSPSTTTSTLPPIEEAQLSHLSGRGALRVPNEESSFCERPLGDPTTPGVVAVALRDATQGGDLYVLCATLGPGADPQSVQLVAPDGTTWAIDLSVDDEYEVFRLNSDDSRGVVGRWPDGSSRYVGLIEPPANFSRAQSNPDDASSRVVQIMFWLPHDRPAGTWQYRFDLGLTGVVADSVEIDRPCATDATSDIGDPFSIPGDLRFTGFANIFGDRDVAPDENCRVWPNFTGLERDDAIAAVDAFATATITRVTIDTSAGECNPDDSFERVVMSQSPDAGSFSQSPITVSLRHGVPCPPVPDDAIGRNWSDLRSELNALAADYPEWTFTTSNALESSCIWPPTVVTGVVGSGGRVLEAGDRDVWNRFECDGPFILGYVFDDADGDGFRDSGEDISTELRRVEMALYDANGVRIDDVFPTLSGQFFFLPIDPGTYTIRLEFLPGSDPLPPGTGVIDGFDQTVMVAVGERVDLVFAVQLP